MRDIVYFLDEIIARPPEKYNRLAYVADILEILGSPQNQIPAIGWREFAEPLSPEQTSIVNTMADGANKTPIKTTTDRKSVV